MESQNIEYKQSWRDDFLKEICGFANAQGGTLYIGMDDKGDVCGVEDAKRLMEDLPNKVRDILGIIVDVQLLEKDGEKYIEIATPPYSNPINYKGKYYYRSGSTNQELKGIALTRFLMSTSGIHWDSAIVVGETIDCLSQDAFKRFRKMAQKSGRVDEEVLSDTNEVLLENLNLVDPQNQLQRAALLLFHPNPERFVNGAYVKIGMFGDGDDDLVFQDEVHGSLMLQVDRVMDLLKTKYLYYAISYNGNHREETLLYPEGALRECVLNAIVHKDYTSAIPIQISVYADHIVVWNSGELPQEWTVEKLYEKHSSQAFNPSLANAFFRTGDIEAWGRGYRRIARLMKEAKLLPPKLEKDNGLMVTFYADIKQQLKEQMGLTERQTIIVDWIKDNPKTSYAKMSQKLAISTSTLKRELSLLQEKEYILHDGKTSSGEWIVPMFIIN